jgi:hypothetical protein
MRTVHSRRNSPDGRSRSLAPRPPRPRFTGTSRCDLDRAFRASSETSVLAVAIGCHRRPTERTCVPHTGTSAASSSVADGLGAARRSGAGRVTDSRSRQHPPWADCDRAPVSWSCQTGVRFGAAERRGPRSTASDRRGEEAREGAHRVPRHRRITSTLVAAAHSDAPELMPGTPRRLPDAHQPSSRLRAVAARTAPAIAARTPRSSSSRRPAAVVPPGEVTIARSRGASP